MTTQVARLVSTGRSWPGEWTREVAAKVNFYHGGEPNDIATPRLVGARNDKRAWCWMKEAATKSWRRDLNLQVSSLGFGTGKGTAASFLPPLDSSRWRGKEADGADEQNDYFYPRRILHREGAGRSWATKNTSNLCGVE